MAYSDIDYTILSYLLQCTSSFLICPSLWPAIKKIVWCAAFLFIYLRSRSVAVIKPCEETAITNSWNRRTLLVILIWFIMQNKQTKKNNKSQSIQNTYSMWRVENNFRPFSFHTTGHNDRRGTHKPHLSQWRLPVCSITSFGAISFQLIILLG